MIEGFTALSRSLLYSQFIILLLFLPKRRKKGSITISYRTIGRLTAANIVERHGEHDSAETGLISSKSLTRSASAIRSTAFGILQAPIVVAWNKRVVDIRVSYF